MPGGSPGSAPGIVADKCIKVQHLPVCCETSISNESEFCFLLTTETSETRPICNGAREKYFGKTRRTGSQLIDRHQSFTNRSIDLVPRSPVSVLARTHDCRITARACKLELLTTMAEQVVFFIASFLLLAPCTLADRKPTGKLINLTAFDFRCNNVSSLAHSRLICGGDATEFWISFFS